jgi:hypothetical protein
MYSFETVFWFSEMLTLFFQVIFCQLLVFFFFPVFQGNWNWVLKVGKIRPEDIHEYLC